MTYHLTPSENGSLLEIGFGDPTENTTIVRDVDTQLVALTTSGELSGGPLLRINGPASLPVAFVLAHRLIHLYQNVAVFDPKLSGYVVVSSHGGGHGVGDLLPI